MKLSLSGLGSLGDAGLRNDTMICDILRARPVARVARMVRRRFMTPARSQVPVAYILFLHILGSMRCRWELVVLDRTAGTSGP